MRELRSRRQHLTNRGRSASFTFEIFVQDGFSEFELASITKTLQTANEIKAEQLFNWRFVSDKPGLVSGSRDVLVRAAPSIPDHAFADWMIVIGSENPDVEIWLKRARAMHQQGLTAILLSGAATAYIKAINATDGAITTHWRDAVILHETGYYPCLTNRFSEKSGNIITSAGSGSTVELVIGLISQHLAPHEIAELGNHLLIPMIRCSETEQPRRIGDQTNLFDQRLALVIGMMERAIEDPLTMQVLAKKAKLSTRQIERMFNQVFEMSPARFYRRLRLKRARALLKETQLSLIDIASATGFGSRDTLSTRFRSEFGVLPSTMRADHKTKYLEYADT